MATRRDILDGTLDLLRHGEPVTLDAVARTVGITKPGVLHHVGSKAELMLSVVDDVVDRWDVALRARLGTDPGTAGPVRRTAAYVEFVLSTRFDASDVAVFADPRLREPLTARWQERMATWFDLDGLSPQVRARLQVARMCADGVWFSEATSLFPVPDAELAALASVLRDLVAPDGGAGAPRGPSPAGD
ncbi:TetR/AcrR family transcriptional regulator [Kineococcus sp. NPDC059986]|uniref:TetR/AcrR family transcriptional regulator n=1 Tax=Kineococcus sp. NPDC059986 TaxID=3155538 RepID=UPI00344B8EC4